MLEKGEIKGIVVEYVKRRLFPKVSTRITKSVIGLGGILMLSQVGSLEPSIFNWIISLLNNYFAIDIPLINTEINYPILLLGFFWLLLVRYFISR